MSIAPNTLPEGAVVEANAKGGAALGPMTVRYIVPTDTIARVFVPVPDGMAYADVEAALADAGAWVPLRGGPTSAHVGCRVRLISALVSHCEISDRVAGFDRGEVRLIACGDNWNNESGEWFIHRDDLPSDPDADRIEKMARALYPAYEGTEHLGDAWENVARAALAVVREHEAKS